MVESPSSPKNAVKLPSIREWSSAGRVTKIPQSNALNAQNRFNQQSIQQGFNQQSIQQGFNQHYQNVQLQQLPSNALAPNPHASLATSNAFASLNAQSSNTQHIPSDINTTAPPYVTSNVLPAPSRPVNLQHPSSNPSSLQNVPLISALNHHTQISPHPSSILQQYPPKIPPNLQYSTENIVQGVNAHLQRIQPYSNSSNSNMKTCQLCGTSKTPEWRKGPRGARTFCNACGLFYSKLVRTKGVFLAGEEIFNNEVNRAKDGRRIIRKRSGEDSEDDPQNSQTTRPLSEE